CAKEGATWADFDSW
nr:immunoglobulin heavy chain junction region [Macaca mulatta]MOW75833.1 immunoglobulin heavy chain junction region [Macaca mulatta]MOW76157.1 immunoglobulin heavy chain junction region [Macaca mulatta]MOW76459.1 immunoglobulin heavy chain junction region [Macaca mulatta]MOW77278.1 immunoglobulin heavy chain junction region [Macaca mulatta]